MRAMFVLPGAALAVGLFVAGASLASASPEDAGKCSVTVDRSGAAGSFDASKQTLDGGSCVCYVTTGAEPDSSDAASKIALLKASGKCGADDKWPLHGADASSIGISNASTDASDDSDDKNRKKDKLPVYLLGGGAGIGGIIAAATSGGNGGNDSTGG